MALEGGRFRSPALCLPGIGCTSDSGDAAAFALLVSRPAWPVRHRQKPAIHLQPAQTQDNETDQSLSWTPARCVQIRRKMLFADGRVINGPIRGQGDTSAQEKYAKIETETREVEFRVLHSQSKCTSL